MRKGSETDSPLFLLGSKSHNDKAKPVVKQGRKATDLIKDSRVATRWTSRLLFFQAVLNLQVGARWGDENSPVTLCT